jgi:hypothetical protein
MIHDFVEDQRGVGACDANDTKQQKGEAKAFHDSGDL